MKNSSFKKKPQASVGKNKKYIKSNKVGTTTASNKLWAGRFSKPTHQLMEDFNASLPFDRRLYKEDIAGSKAHAQMLEKIGVLTKTETTTILKGLNQVEKFFHTHKVNFANVEEDIHTKIENELRDRIGDLAGKLHTGRSRNDQSNLDVRLYLRHKIDVVTDQLGLLLVTLIKGAEKHPRTIMPGMTHFQPAQVISYSYYLLAYVFMFTRDYERLLEVRKRVNALSLGAGALAGVNYPSDRAYLKKLLRFDTVMENAMDAVSSRDHLLEFHNTVAILMTNISRLAEELIVFSNPQFGFVRVDEQYATGSSIMPNKVNPDSLELIRGKVGRILGNLTGLFTTMKGLPLAYNKDFQEDKESLFDTIDTVTQVLPVLNGVMDTLSVYPQKMQMACENGYLQATDVADYLAKKGLPFRNAHKVSAEIVKHLESTGKTYSELSLVEYQSFSKLFEQDIFKVVDLKNQIMAKQSPGSTSPRSVTNQIRTAKRRIQALNRISKNNLNQSK